MQRGEGGGGGGVQADGLKCRYVVHVKPTLHSALLPELGLKTAEIQASLQSALFSACVLFNNKSFYKWSGYFGPWKQ